MTIEELAELSADKLKALSTAELDAILSPYYTVTRPEYAPKPQTRLDAQPVLQLSAAKRAALEMLQAEGVDVGFLKKKRK